MPSSLTGSRKEPFLAFAVLLSTLIAASFIIQFIGDVLNVSLVRYALPIAFLPCLGLTYGYFFAFSRSNILVGLILTVILTALGVESTQVRDFSQDAMDYHQPSVDAILHGWNPLYTDVPLFWQKLHPFGAWSVEASLVALYGSIETAKMLHIWLLFIALPVLLAGIRNLFSRLQFHHYALAWLLILNPIVLAQCFTHYVDAMLYVEGVIFMGALMMQDDSPRQNQLSCLLMAVALLLIINTKLSGVCWGAMLCAGAVAYLYCEQKKIPWKMAGFLFIIGMVSTLIFGYHPYITNLLKWGALTPMSSEELVKLVLPHNFKPLSGSTRFFYSLFSVEGGDGGEDATLKWPWIIKNREWSAGNPGPLMSGFGPLFAMGTLLAMTLVCFTLFKRKQFFYKGLALLALTLLVSCMFFPESWWARYAPFAYAVPFLLLLASYPTATRAHFGLYLVVAVFAANSFIAGRAVYLNHVVVEASYYQVIDNLHKLSPRSVYLVPWESGRIDYQTINRGDIAIARWLHAAGIDATVKAGAPCDHKIASWIEIDVCYEE